MYLFLFHECSDEFDGNLKFNNIYLLICLFLWFKFQSFQRVIVYLILNIP